MTERTTQLHEPLIDAEAGLECILPSTGQEIVAAGNTGALSVTHQEDPDKSSHPVDSYSLVLARRHGLSANTALAINLAALSAAVGPTRTIKNPLGITLTAALNVVVENATGADVRRAATQALASFLRTVTKKITDHQNRGAKDSRQLRILLDAECAQALRHLRSPPEKPREPCTVPVPAEERQKQALEEATKEAQEVAEQMRLHEFEEKPFLITDGLSARDLAELRQHSFDTAVFNFCPDQQGLRGLETMRPTDRTKVLRFLKAAWHHEPFLAGADTIVAPVATNLWLLEPGDTAAAWQRSAVAASGLLETFVVVANDVGLAPDPAASADTAPDEQWNTLVEVLLGERILGDRQEHRLSAPAEQRFLDFHHRTRSEATPETRKLRAWWPEQVLKIGLLLHVSAGEEVADEIPADTLERAIGLVEAFGVEQGRVLGSGAHRQREFEVEMDLMVAKVRLHGPLPIRDLFRHYHVQSYDQLEPVLARCCERKLVQIKDGLICPEPASA